MEFQAAIEALKVLPSGSKATIYSDSQILIHTVNVMIPEWRSSDWTKKNGSPIPNVDLVKIIAELDQQHFIKWQWIKAHSGIAFNERCDELCIEARGLV
ncbi:Ribonuclease HI [compost metagenome]